MAKKKQMHMPGAEPARNEKVHAAAETYADCRKEFVKASKAKAVAHENLLDAMRVAKLKKYSYDDVTVEREGTEKVKVKVAKAKANTETDDDKDNDDE